MFQMVAELRAADKLQLSPCNPSRASACENCWLSGTRRRYMVPVRAWMLRPGLNW